MKNNDVLGSISYLNLVCHLDLMGVFFSYRTQARSQDFAWGGGGGGCA